jgi:hypothetical protein
MRRRTLSGAVGVAALLLSLAAVGCGGSTSSSSEASVQWANGVCGAVSAWKGELTRLAGSVRANGLSEQSLRTTAASVQAVTRTMASTLKSLGPPKTSGGEQAKQSIDTLANELSQGAATIAKALDSGSITTAATTIATTFTSMKTAAQQTVTTLQSLDTTSELRDAFKQADNCTALTGST